MTSIGAPALDALAAAERASSLAAELGHADIAEGLAQERARVAGQEITAVVVGEQKRGKSSFINALIGREDLLPVDVDVATSCYLLARHGPATRVLVHSDEHPEGVEIAPERIAEYASVDGNRDPDDDTRLLHDGVRFVEILVDDPLLARGIALVDTPGVGGLDAGHTEITLATLRRADALVFVVDPDAPLKEPELRFLEAATERIRSVAFVLSKIEIYPGWERLLEENKRLLATHAPAYVDAPWFPVDSVVRLDAFAAAAAGLTTRAEDLHAQSGFGPVEAYLTGTLAARAEAVRAENLLAAVRVALARMTESEEQQKRIASGDPTLAQELTAQQAVLTELTRGGARWPNDLRAAFRRVDLDVQREFQRRLREVRRRGEDAVGAWSASLLEDLPRDLDEGLRGIWMEITGLMQQGAAGVYASLARDLDEAGTDVLAVELPYPERLRELPPLQRAAEADGSGSLVEEYLPVLSAGGMTAGFLIRLGHATAAMNPLTLLAGIGVGLFMKNRRKERQDRMAMQRDARRYLARAMEDAGQEMTHEIRTVLLDLERATADRVRERIAARRRELEVAVQDAKARMSADQADREPALRAAQERLDRLAELRAELGSAAQLVVRAES